MNRKVVIDIRPRRSGKTTDAVRKTLSLLSEGKKVDLLMSHHDVKDNFGHLPTGKLFGDNLKIYAGGYAEPRGIPPVDYLVVDEAFLGKTFSNILEHKANNIFIYTSICSNEQKELLSSLES